MKQPNFKRRVFPLTKLEMVNFNELGMVSLNAIKQYLIITIDKAVFSRKLRMRRTRNYSRKYDSKSLSPRAARITCTPLETIIV